ncbi:MAG: hypothetical protein UX98_C0023G0002 [Parcubacteria group bacterium GW2011_GWA2_47_26]|nr:MAG: hypothetical protein UX98_C0023G0002 [Parcubacteria group bacterium GW2011_GWA2_47_26]
MAEHYGCGVEVVGYGVHSSLPGVETRNANTVDLKLVGALITHRAKSSVASASATRPASSGPTVAKTEKGLKAVVVTEQVELVGENWQVLRTVQVRKGWWVALYVSKTSGASLELTLLCNGWQVGSNPVVQPGQTMKICGKLEKRQQYKLQPQRVPEPRRDKPLRRNYGAIPA